LIDSIGLKISKSLKNTLLCIYRIFSVNNILKCKSGGPENFDLVAKYVYWRICNRAISAPVTTSKYTKIKKMMENDYNKRKV